MMHSAIIQILCHLCYVSVVLFPMGLMVQRMYKKKCFFFLDITRILMSYTSDQTLEESLSLTM